MKYGLALLIAVIALGGCKAPTKTAQPAPGVLNAKCPMSGRAVSDGPTADFKDGKVMFCCNGCKGKWAGLSDAERAERLEKAVK